METWKIEGMHCAHCVKAVTDALEELGLREVRVDLEEGTARFAPDPQIGVGVITQAIDDIGFSASPLA